MFHKIKSVTPLADHVLSVQFSEGVTKRYDVKSLFDKYPMFLPLKDDPALFSSVEVDVGGYGIVWNDDIDIACDELFYNGEIIKTPFDGLIAFSDATQLWGLNESTLKFGKQWVISSHAMRREYGEPKVSA